MKRRFAIMDVFTSEVGTGNQLGVVYDCEGLQTETMQKIAVEFGYAETIFLSPATHSGSDAGVRIFTPANELPFAGHPTIGASIAVARQKTAGDGGTFSIVLEEKIGPVHCEVTLEQDKSSSRFVLPKVAERMEPAGSTFAAAAAVGLSENDVGFDAHQHSAFHGGLPYELLPVKSLAQVAKASPKLEIWREGFGTDIHNSAYVYCRETVDPANDFHARMFAPDAGIPEDPATGSAVASFAGAITSFENLADGTHTIKIEQGIEMGRPSVITLEITLLNGIMQSGYIGGSAVFFAEGHINIA